MSMRTGRKYGKLTPADVLYLIAHKTIAVCPLTGTVTGSNGREIRPTLRTPDHGTTRRSGQPRYFVRITSGGRRINIARAKLVWMAVTGLEPPAGFQVHHDDDNCQNDSWANLICLHELDHRKQHSGPRAIDDDTEPPF